MRQVHRAGEKVFIDYSGKKPRTWSSETGEAIEVELYVAVLGASNYTFAAATRTQRLEAFCASTVRAFEFFGSVPQIAVPDQLRSAVSGPDRYDPDINPNVRSCRRGRRSRATRQRSKRACCWRSGGSWHAAIELSSASTT